MALVIENTIDLTANSGNPSPKYVAQLSIIHESSSGELVQYYIDPSTRLQGDKNTYAIGVYDKDSQSYSYTEYPSITWNASKQRIYGGKVDFLGVKAFPGIGSFAFYRLSHRKITRIVIPVNKQTNEQNAPTLSAEVNSDWTTTFTITPPKEPEYECYRIVMDYDIYSEEWITYELEFTAPQPKITGEYRCYAIGYGSEGQLFSRDSNVVVLDLVGRNDEFVKPYYGADEFNELLERMDQLETKVNEHKIEKDVPADAVFTDTVYDDRQLRGQIRANKNNIGLLMGTTFDENTYWLIDSDDYQIVDSNGYPIYMAQYTSKIDELQSRKYLYWDNAEEEEGSS